MPQQPIELSWGVDLEGLPGVVFGLAHGTPRQILFQADPSRSRQLYLNGFWTAAYCLEEDLLEQFDLTEMKAFFKALDDAPEDQIACANRFMAQYADEAMLVQPCRPLRQRLKITF